MPVDAPPMQAAGRRDNTRGNDDNLPA